VRPVGRVAELGSLGHYAALSRYPTSASCDVCIRVHRQFDCRVRAAALSSSPTRSILFICSHFRISVRGCFRVADSLSPRPSRPGRRLFSPLAWLSDWRSVWVVHRLDSGIIGQETDEGLEIMTTWPNCCTSRGCPQFEVFFASPFEQFTFNTFRPLLQIPFHDFAQHMDENLVHLLDACSATAGCEKIKRGVACSPPPVVAPAPPRSSSSSPRLRPVSPSSSAPLSTAAATTRTATPLDQ
jgi:hypothetical protein